MKTDKQIKMEATKKMNKLVYENMILPGNPIIAECSDGTWIRRYWKRLNRFGWDKWTKLN